jgi:hypothetical protein
VAVKDSNKFVVILSYLGTDIALGYDSLGEAVILVESQIDEADTAKMFNYVQEALNEGGVTVEGITYKVMDSLTYFDLYETETDEDE